jgi:hypothetical protein
MGYLVRFLPEPKVRELLLSASAMKEQRSREEILKGAAIRLAELGFGSEAMDMAVEITGNGYRSGALRGLSTALAGRPPGEWKPLWDKAIVRLAQRNRASLVSDLVALAPLVGSLGGAAAIRQTGEATRNVGRWWP